MQQSYFTSQVSFTYKFSVLVSIFNSKDFQSLKVIKSEYLSMKHTLGQGVKKQTDSWQMVLLLVLRLTSRFLIEAKKSLLPSDEPVIFLFLQFDTSTRYIQFQ